MSQSLETMVARYAAQTPLDRKNAVKEAVQEIILCGLSRARFFDQAAFYEGTALRIFYGLDRYSEDLDFSLVMPDPSFDLADYFAVLEKEVRSFGLNVQIERKEKTVDSAIHSAFVKGNTIEHMLLFYPDADAVSGVAPDEKIKIKFEVDTDPAPGASYERRYRLTPAPYEVRLYDEASLFAGKIHAVLCRSWKNRVKGRDLYDYIFYLSRGARVNLPHLRAKLVQTGSLPEEEPLDIRKARLLLSERFDAIDFVAARRDVEPFLSDTKQLDLWSPDFFKQVTEGLQPAE